MVCRSFIGLIPEFDCPVHDVLFRDGWGERAYVLGGRGNGERAFH